MSTTTAQREVKKKYALAAIEKARANGHANPIIVMPVFMEDDNDVYGPTNETGISGKNIEWCAVNVVANTTAFRGGFKVDTYQSALIRMRVSSNTFKAGQVLGGKIYTVESTVPSNPANIEDGIKYISSALREAKMPCLKDGKVVYQQHFYTDNMSEPDVLIAHDNADELANAGTQLKASNSPQAGLGNAAAKAAKIAELQAIPKAKRTTEQKMELADLMEA